MRHHWGGDSGEHFRGFPQGKSHVRSGLVAGGIEGCGERVGELVDIGDGDVEAELVDGRGHGGDASVRRLAELQGLGPKTQPAVGRQPPSPPPR